MKTGAERYLESRLEDPEYRLLYDTIRTQMTKVPEDTSKRTSREHLLDAMNLGPSGFIEAQEAQGQRQMVNSDVLPTDIGYTHTKEDYEALGFTFGAVVEDDPLFQNATLPEGWSRKGSSHSMWSYIADQRGVERVGIFYKAAFYDRSAHMSITNVGGKLASDFIYGESSLRDDADRTKKTLDEMWPILTDLERLAFVQSLHGWVERWRESPHIYGQETNVVMIRSKYEALALKYLPSIQVLASYVRW